MHDEIPYLFALVIEWQGSGSENRIFRQGCDYVPDDSAAKAEQ